MSAKGIYDQTVRALPPTGRLRLAAIILDDLAQPSMLVVESSDGWSEEDQRDLTTFSLQHAAAVYPEDEDLV
jgi:hypothetical protein